MKDLSLRHVGSSSLTRDEPSHLHWERGILATGPLGKLCILTLILEVSKQKGSTTEAHVLGKLP